MRRHNFQTIAWLNDLRQRGLVNLDPPYQRRSVWSQEYKSYFIDTITLEYPAPAIFLFEKISDTGIPRYNVVDGKQRLISVFSFIDNAYPVSEQASIHDLRGKYFSEFSSEQKAKFWSYTFLVEYLPSEDEAIINTIFDRINRNVARLSSQELRHARFFGPFITTCEDLTDWFDEVFPKNFPRMGPKSKSQMKDVEFIAQLLLLIEEGPRGFSSDELDLEFLKREETWEEKNKVEDEFRAVTLLIISLLKTEQTLERSRFQNQADLYSLFGGIMNLLRKSFVINPADAAEKLSCFLQKITDDSTTSEIAFVQKYVEHIRFASNRTLARKERIEIIEKVLFEGL